MASDANPSSWSLDPEARDCKPSCIGGGQKTEAGPDSSIAPRKPILKLNATTSGGQASRTAGALYPSTVWSPSTVLDTRSAGLPLKPTWAGALFPPGTSSTSNNVKLFPGLGVSATDGDVFDRDSNHRLDFQARGSNVRFTQTKEYHTPPFTQTKEFHNSAKSGTLVVKTDPLPQHQFPDFQQKPNMNWSKANSSRQLTDSSGPPTPTICISPAVDLPPTHASQPSISSAASSFSRSQGGEGDKDSDKPAHDVWTERQQGRCLRRALKDPDAQWEPAYEGALTVLAAANPEHFKMVAGSVVINIKTEFLENLITSVRVGKYSVMDRVSERIMEVYNSRKPTQSVLFMFSVNGGKKFSGLAEMSGPWDPSAFIDGWSQNPECPACAGSFEVRWIYIKDVWYQNFDEIRQPANQHPVSNMWNGMKFPDETGREVVKLFVQTPATASILGHPKNYPENNSRRDGNDSCQRKGAPSNRGPRGGGRGGSRCGANNNSWRVQSAQKNRNGAVQEHQDSDATPTAAKPGRLTGHILAPPRSGLPGASAVQPGESAQVSIDENGNIVLTTTSVTTTNISSASSSFSSAGSGCQHSGMNRRSQHFMPPRLNTHGSHGSLHHSQHSDAMSASSGHSNAMASPAFNSPQRFFPTRTDRQAGLQQSASMSVLGSQHPARTTDARALLPSGSMNSLPLQLGSIPGHRQHSAWRTEVFPPFEQHYNGSLPLRGTPASSSQPRGVQNTPTHRPNAQIKLDTAVNFALGEEANEHQLRARYHSLQADKCSLQHQLHGPGTTVSDRRFLEAQLVRNAVEIRTAEMNLGMTSSSSGDLSPERYDSFQYGDGSSTSSGGGSGLSPMRAENGTPLDSVSILGSPHHFARDGHFGGPGDGMYGDSVSDQPPYGCAIRSSWVLQGPNVDGPVLSTKDDSKNFAVQMSSQGPFMGDNGASAGHFDKSPLNFSFGGPSKGSGQSANTKGRRTVAQAVSKRQNGKEGGVRLDI